MIWQHDKRLHKNIQESGCYFLSLLAICEIEKKLALTTEEINSIYYKAITENSMLPDCEIKNPDRILDLGYAMLKTRGKTYQIGTCIGGKFEYNGWVKDKTYHWVIEDRTTSGSFGHHFVLLDVKQRVIYDPMFGQGYTQTGTAKFVLYQTLK